MDKSLKRATFAGGCFWCTESFFKEVQGVLSVTPGYAGGDEANPTYESIHSGNSNYAECVQIEFDPQIVPYEVLVRIFFGTHDPTQINGQGNDRGAAYRSIIFYHFAEQKEIAERVKQEISDQEIYQGPIVTSIEPFTSFYEAEPEHKDFYEKNPGEPYCQVVIDPKIAKFRKEYSQYIQKK